MVSVFSQQIIEITDNVNKSTICNHILRQLPQWFGIEESIVEYTGKVKELQFFAIGNKEPVTGMPVDLASITGFIAIETHYKHSAEIHVMGVVPLKHRSGSGKKLVEAAEEFCEKKGIKFLTVKTLSGSHKSEDYRKTRKFYEAMGFEPLEEFKTLWDEHNPCLYMIKVL